MSVYNIQFTDEESNSHLCVIGTESNDEKICELTDEEYERLTEIWNKLEAKEPFLPTEINIPVNEIEGETEEEIEESISDYITEDTGYCHNGFQYTLTDDHYYVYNINWDTTEN